MRVLLTGGRAPATLELARLLWRAGHHVEVAEHIAWHLSRGSRAVARHHRLPAPASAPGAFIDALLRTLRARRIDRYLPMGEEIFAVAAARERVAAATSVLCPPLPALLRLHHKGRFVEAVRAAGLLAPATREVESRDALLAALTAAWDGGQRVVVKAAYSRFAARLVIDPRRPADVDGLQPTPADPFVVQDLVEGVQRCTYGVARAGRLVAHAAYTTRYTLGRGASVHFVADPDPTLRRWAAQLVEAEAFDGQIAFDLISDAEGQLHGIECNPRVTSGLHLLAHRPGLIPLLLGGEAPTLDAAGAPSAMLGTSMLIAGRDALRRGELSAWWRAFRAARDVGADRADPVPMLLSRFVWMAGVLLRARRLGLSPQRAATVDVDYDGADLAALALPGAEG